MKIIQAALLFMLPATALAAAENSTQHLDLTRHWVGIAAIVVFVIAYALVIAEDYIKLRKSKPVILAAGIIWSIIAWAYVSQGLTHEAEAAVRHNLLEYAELMLFLLVAMTYINAMQERNVFEALKTYLVRAGFSYRSLFWITGVLAFLISPVADNLTTALLMCAVVMAVGSDKKKFVLLSAINIVVAANAGGAFSPFGDITTLMVWQKEVQTEQGLVDFWSFFSLFIPAAVNWLVPATIMSFAVPVGQPRPSGEAKGLKRGATGVVTLFFLTVLTAVAFHNFLYLPPVIGMLTGLGYLQIFGYYLKTTAHLGQGRRRLESEHAHHIGNPVSFDVFDEVARAEWDTLLFFYGVVLCVGGLGFIGYLSLASNIMYLEWGATNTNIAIGMLSAFVDNIPVMFAVLTMMPDMSKGQWLLVTLTAGVGGSLLSIGSAAGVALMGQTRGIYTFFGHLKWAPIIALGYIAGVAVHLWLNSSLFGN